MDDSVEIQETNDLISYLNDVLFEDYEPAKGPVSTFWERLSIWVDNASEESQQKDLFQFVPKIFFVGRHEFDTLFRAAFNEHVIQWLIDQENITFSDTNYEKHIYNAVKNTWFCPITDSLRINAFYHVNNIESFELRPDWKSLRTLGDRENIRNYIENKNIKRLVLLEDFVGSGTQMANAIKFACKISPELKILIVPLIICPQGLDKGKKLEKTHENVLFRPVVKLPKNYLINNDDCDERPENFKRIKNLMIKLQPQLNLDVQADKANEHMGLFGFKNTGATVVMFSNCPNNSLPIVHLDNEHWAPLFPRSGRI